MQVRLWDRVSSAALNTVVDENRTLAAQSVTDITLSVAAELSTVAQIELRVEPPVHRDDGTLTTINPDPFIYLRWAQLSIGPDPQVPPIQGSHANAMHQRGNQRLFDLSQDPDEFEVELLDLSASTEYVLEDERPTLGGRVRLYKPELGIDRELRITSIWQDMVDPKRARLTLSRRPTRATHLISQHRPQSRIAVQVDVSGTTSTGGTAGAGTGAPISSEPDVKVAASQVVLSSPNEAYARERGALRAIAPITGATTGTVTPSPYDLT
jgi:hypothetical protein